MSSYKYLSRRQSHPTLLKMNAKNRYRMCGSFAIQRRKRRTARVAFAAITEDLQMMPDGVKPHCAASVFLELLELLRHELDYFVALEADHVLVMLMPVHVLEVRAMRAVENFAQDADFAEQHEAAVDCCLRCLRADFAH